MRVQDLAQLSTRMFKTNPLRTWLTILGMGVGTGAVVVLVGLLCWSRLVRGEELLTEPVVAVGGWRLVVVDGG